MHCLDTMQLDMTLYNHCVDFTVQCCQCILVMGALVSVHGLNATGTTVIMMICIPKPLHVEWCHPFSSKCQVQLSH